MNKKKAITLVCVTLMTTGGYLLGVDNGKQQKVDQILNTMSDLQMEWYMWQDVEKIVESKSIHYFEQVNTRSSDILDRTSRDKTM